MPAARLRSCFLLALRWAGRQYRTFAGIAHGRHTHRSFAKLITDGFATTDLIAPAHAGRIYHVRYKPWYGRLASRIIRTGGR